MFFIDFVDFLLFDFCISFFLKLFWLPIFVIRYVFLKVTMFTKKLDGVGPVDNRLSTDKLHHFVRKKKRKKKKKKKNVPCDTWHVTRDTWHVTRDTWHVTHGGEWTLSQYFSFQALTVWDWQCFEDSEHKGSPNQLIN